MEGPASIIRKAMHKLGAGKEQKFYQHWVFWHWPEIVGDFIARYCEPQGIRKGILYLYCQNAPMANEIRLMSLRLIERINAFAGQEMVKEVAFSRRWEHPDSEGVDELRLAKQKRAPNIGAQRRRMGVTPRDMERAQQLGESAGDADIGAKVKELYCKAAQMRQLKLSKGWHPCRECGRLTEPGEELCFACELKRRERIKEGVRQVLRDIPWARCKEVREYVPECTPALLNEQRAIMVQNLAKEVELKDVHTLKAKNLVMLYRCLPPAQLNEDVIRRGLYALRNNLHKPKDYQPPKRYEYLKLGRQKETSGQQKGGA